MHSKLFFKNRKFSEFWSVECICRITVYLAYLFWHHFLDIILIIIIKDSSKFPIQGIYYFVRDIKIREKFIDGRVIVYINDSNLIDILVFQGVIKRVPGTLYDAVYLTSR